MLNWLEKHLEEALCCTALVIIAVTVFAQVLLRYFLDTALHWTEEVTSIAMVWAVYMGASLCVRERFHIRILVAVHALPARLGRYVIFLADIAWAAFSVLMLRVSWAYLEVLWHFPSYSPSLGVNQFYPQSILIIGYGLMLLRLVQTYVLWLRAGAEGLPGMLVEDGDRTSDEEHPV